MSDLRVVRVTDAMVEAGVVTFKPSDVIDLEAASGEVFGGFAESRSNRGLSEIGNPDGFGAWYWQFFVWHPATHITRGYGDSLEVIEWSPDDA